MLSPLVIPKVGNPGSVLLIDDINESFLFAIKNEHLQDARLCLEKEANIDTRTEVRSLLQLDMLLFLNKSSTASIQI